LGGAHFFLSLISCALKQALEISGRRSFLGSIADNLIKIQIRRTIKELNKSGDLINFSASQGIITKLQGIVRRGGFTVGYSNICWWL
jgi:hypothetical protein